MSSSEYVLTDAHKRQLGRLLNDVLVFIRSSSDLRQISEVADAFHNLAGDLWEQSFDLADFRDYYLKPLYERNNLPLVKGWLSVVDSILDSGKSAMEPNGPRPAAAPRPGSNECK